MKKIYEYKIVSAEQYEDFEAVLNENGKEGWDLANYTINEITDSEGEKIKIIAVMKRELITV